MSRRACDVKRAQTYFHIDIFPKAHHHPQRGNPNMKSTATILRTASLLLLLGIVVFFKIGCPENPLHIADETGKILTKEYQVPAGVFTPGTKSNPNSDSPTAEEFLPRVGVQFPPGASAYYYTRGSRLIVKNTQENLHIVDTIVEALWEADAQQTAIEHWLALIDKEKYAESWEAASPLLREQFTKPQWERAMETMRKPLGKNISRTEIGSEFPPRRPGNFNWRHVSFYYASVFEHQASATEALVLAREGKQAWRVSGYSIK